MRTKFVQAEVFPFVADAIGRVYARAHDFVTHREIVSAMLDDDRFVNAMEGERPDNASLGRRVSNMVAWFSQRITVGKSRYQVYFVHRARKGGRWAYKPPTAEPPLGDDPDGAVAEGYPELVFHLRRERDRTLVRRKKQDVIRRHGALACQACGFDFAREGPCFVRSSATANREGHTRLGGVHDASVVSAGRYGFESVGRRRNLKKSVWLNVAPTWMRVILSRNPTL